MINTPGTAAAAATAMDGNALAKKGQPRRALEIALYSSVMADLLATLVLIFVAAPLAAFALKFSSPEFTMLFLFSLTMISAVSGESLPKGLISAGLGVLLACIGLDPMSGYIRYTFGISYLMGGVSLIPLLIGMFAISEILIQSEKREKGGIASSSKGREPHATFSDFKRILPTILTSSGIVAWPQLKRATTPFVLQLSSR
jgi:putative tricarboxylic transport membrane protein